MGRLLYWLSHQAAQARVFMRLYLPFKKYMEWNDGKAELLATYDVLDIHFIVAGAFSHYFTNIMTSSMVVALK